MITRDKKDEHRRELRDRVLAVAMPMFKKRGVKSVRMDEIASSLSISKRTLYEIFDSKEALILEGIKRNKERTEARLAEYAASGANEMEILIEFLRTQMNELQNVSPDYFADIDCYPRVMEYLHVKSARHRARSMEFTRRGIEHGYFISNINYDIFTIVCDVMMEQVMKLRMYEKYPMREIMHTLVSLLLRGCCTEKGRKMLDDVL